MTKDQTTRRTVLRTAVWTTPVITAVSAAPAFAASPNQCAQQTLNWAAGRTDGQKIPAVVTSAPTAGGTTPSTQVTVFAAGTAGSPDNLTVNTARQGNVAPNLILQFDRTAPLATTPSQTVTMAFAPAVSDLTFTILDIDSSNNTGANAGNGSYYDHVTISPGYTITAQPATVVGDGTTPASAFRYVNPNTRVDTTGTAGNVTVNYPGPIVALTLTYFSVVPLSSNQMQIALSNFTFKRAGC